jgi:hypothetical protein
MLKRCVLLLVVCLTGCTDKYQEGYAAGYEEGEAAARAREVARCEEQQREQERHRTQADSPSAYVTTDVCGGTGVNVNGRHVSGGSTGCVRVYSDGRFQRY